MTLTKFQKAGINKIGNFTMKIIILLALVASEVYSTKLDPLSDEFINYINSKQSTWKAGRNFDKNTTIEDIKKMCGAILTKPTPGTATKIVHSEPVDIPESFDSREHWPECKHVIGTIADQSACGSCWAVAATSSISDRRCIHSKGKLDIPVSARDLLSCCSECGHGCQGGYIERAWNYWHEHGIVTGGAYNSSVGCRSYPLEPCEHHINGTKKSCTELHYSTPSCERSCENPSLTYKQELTFGKTGAQWFADEKSIQREILLNGPVEAGFRVYSDFLTYKSGIYQHLTNEALTGHAVRIVGWGVENDVPYWRIANSWNEEWGEDGYFRILRGTNEVEIEDQVFASLPKI